MWPFRRKPTSQNFQVNQGLVAIVDDYLTVIPEQGNWEDEEVFQKLKALGHDPKAAWAIVGLVPSFVGRYMMRNFGPQFSDRVDIFVKGRVVASHDLSSYPPYVAISSRSSQILQYRNVKTLGLRSAEANAINTLLLQGSNPKDLRTTPIGLLEREEF